MLEKAVHLADSAGWKLEALDQALRSAADPDTALVSLDRWLVATGNIRMNAEELAARPEGWARLANLLGASQPMAECLVQNPEFAHLVLFPSSEDAEREGNKLLANAPSYSYRLDRLRYLKQRETVKIVDRDLAGIASPAETWRALSDIADVILRLTYRIAWEQHSLMRGLQYPCPVGIVAFGKHGGQELNYNSDIDLCYVVQDGLSETEERESLRFAEAFGRAITERMGRGILYRLDFRLRPYGTSGSLVPSMRATESYYERYAEPWEAMALIRSRYVLGPPELSARWDALRTAYAFPSRTSEGTVDSFRALRLRIEAEAPADDIKRGFGGIRDPEFATQLIQLINGGAHPELRGRDTLTAMAAIRAVGIPFSPALTDGYVSLRRLEHYLQLRNDSQTHRIPPDRREKTAIARLMGWPENELDGESAALRSKVRIGYLATVGEVLLPPPAPYAFSPFEEGVVNEWFYRLPDGAVFRHQLDRNRDSGERVARIARVAPRLATLLSEQVAVTELVLSGEILEVPPASRTVNRANYLRNCSLALAYEVLNRGLGFETEDSLEETLTEFADAVILSTAKECGLDAQIYGLGSLGNRLMAPNSDADLLFLAAPAHREEAERAASGFLRTLREASLLSVDLRLRPDGGKGLLVRTPAALRYYSDTDMDPWERFALGHARPLNECADVALVYEVAYAGLSDSDVASLADMKRRIETERVEFQHGSRNVKLGPGGLLDIEWLVHLCEMRYVTAMDVGPGKRFSDRILSLSRAGLMNALETDALLQAHRWLLDLRVAIWLQGSDGDVLPENPDRLDRIAEFMGDNNGNATLAKHAETVSMVRRLYEMAWEILAR